jgi:hypothetical protein
MFETVFIINVRLCVIVSHSFTCYSTTVGSNDIGNFIALFLQLHFFNKIFLQLRFLHNYLVKSKGSKNKTKGHSLFKQCLHNLQFMKKGSSSPNLSKLARADISCQFMKTRSLCRTVHSAYIE